MCEYCPAPNAHPSVVEAKRDETLESGFDDGPGFGDPTGAVRWANFLAREFRRWSAERLAAIRAADAETARRLGLHGKEAEDFIDIASGAKVKS